MKFKTKIIIFSLLILVLSISAVSAHENITIDETTASAIKIEVVNTEIGNDHFVIQGVSAYNIPKGE